MRVISEVVVNMVLSDRVKHGIVFVLLIGLLAALNVEDVVTGIEWGKDVYWLTWFTPGIKVVGILLLISFQYVYKRLLERFKTSEITGPFGMVMVFWSVSIFWSLFFMGIVESTQKYLKVSASEYLQSGAFNTTLTLYIVAYFLMVGVLIFMVNTLDTIKHFQNRNIEKLEN